MTILQGVMLIPSNSYQGSGEALYYKNVKDAELDSEGYMVSVPVEFAIESDDQHNTLRAIISSWQAI